MQVVLAVGVNWGLSQGQELRLTRQPGFLVSMRGADPISLHEFVYNHALRE